MAAFVRFGKDSPSRRLSTIRLRVSFQRVPKIGASAVKKMALQPRPVVKSIRRTCAFYCLSSRELRRERNALTLSLLYQTSD
jgi:hypothetical protein